MKHISAMSKRFYAATAFRGTKWQGVNNPTTRQYILNKYRVLLTRAREGLVVWVPHGDPNDSTRESTVYAGIAEYLVRCGMRSI